MKKQTHNVVADKVSFENILKGKKSFKLKRYRRNFKTGDFINFQERKDNLETGRCEKRVIAHAFFHKDFPDRIPSGYAFIVLE